MKYTKLLLVLFILDTALLTSGCSTEGYTIYIEGSDGASYHTQQTLSKHDATIGAQLIEGLLGVHTYVVKKSVLEKELDKSTPVTTFPSPYAGRIL